MVCEENNQMDDIQYLLYLEALKRYTEEIHEVQRQVEEQVRIHTEVKREYKREFVRLANLCKQTMLSEALEVKSSTQIDHSQVERTLNDLAKSTATLSNKIRPTQLNTETLKECKVQLQSQHHKPRCQLAKHQSNFAQTLETLKTASTILESVGNKFDAATLMAMDQFTSELQAPDKENTEI